MPLLLAFNIALSLAGGLAGIVLADIKRRLGALEEAKHTNERLAALESADRERMKQISSIKEDLPAHYLSRTDFKDEMSRTRSETASGLSQVLAAVQRIEDQLKGKVDKI